MVDVLTPFRAGPPEPDAELPNFMFNEKTRRTLFSFGVAPFLITSFGAPVSAIIGPPVILDDQCINEEVLTKEPYHVLIKPLADEIARGEGDYNAVNRGYAGDTPGGIQGLTGYTFENYTVNDVMAYQKTWLYAVGRYQFIPRTLRFAVANTPDVDKYTMFTPDVQDKLFATLLDHKRPQIGQYIRGQHNNLGWALDGLAREWASVEYRSGRGYYDYIGGNRAHISRVDAARALNTARDNVTRAS